MNSFLAYWPFTASSPYLQGGFYPGMDMALGKCDVLGLGFLAVADEPGVSGCPRIAVASAIQYKWLRRLHGEGERGGS